MATSKTTPTVNPELNPARLRYPFPAGLSVRLIWSALAGKQRSFLQDAHACISHLSPPLLVTGSDKIPAQGPCLVSVNHYSRPGFQAWWIALAISAHLPFEVHWVMTDAWRFEGRAFSRQLEMLTRWGFRRAARVYGFTSMPPMPPREDETAARARSVRGLLEHARHAVNPVIGLVPEGYDIPGGMLGVPPPGVGRLVGHLMPYVQRILPAAVYEQQGQLCLRFGEPYTFEMPTHATRERIDRLNRDRLMRSIAALMPSHLQGAYACDEPPHPN